MDQTFISYQKIFADLFKKYDATIEKLENENIYISKPTERLKMTDNYHLVDSTEFINSFIPKFSDEVIKQNPTYTVDDHNGVHNDFFSDNIKLWEEAQFIQQKPLRHQKFVINFLNKNTPYRGLMFYHGLGSGKTGASILTASGYDKDTLVMTPASLQGNFKDEIKERFGKNYLKTHNHWVWVPLKYTKYNNKLTKLTVDIPSLSTKLAKILDIFKKIVVNKRSRQSNIKTIQPYINVDANELIDKLTKLPEDTLLVHNEQYKRLDDMINEYNTKLKEFNTVKEGFSFNKKLYVKHTDGDFIETGIWMIKDDEDTENYSKLSKEYQGEINNQIKILFEKDYNFFNYNSGGYTIAKLFDTLLSESELLTIKNDIGFADRLNITNAQELVKASTFKFTKDETNQLLEKIYDDSYKGVSNPFDNKVIIIDEIHNLTSRITSGSIIGLRLYELLMRSKNSNFILLSGTPAINIPYQLAITFNILKGITTVFNFKISGNITNSDELKKVLYLQENVDRFMLSNHNNTVQITMVYSGFINDYKDSVRNGVIENGVILSDNEFIKIITDYLSKFNYNVSCTKNYQSLFPDCLEKQKNSNILLNTKILNDQKLNFMELYVDSDKFIVNEPFKIDFQKRIVGLVSHYNEISIEDQDVFPSVIYAEDEKVSCELSNYQFLIYMNNRKKEYDLEIESNKSKIINGEDNSFSYYKVLTRQSGNFVFPSSLPRPTPSEFKTKQVEYNILMKKKVELLDLLLIDISDNDSNTREEIINHICDKINKDDTKEDEHNFKYIYNDLINIVKSTNNRDSQIQTLNSLDDVITCKTIEDDINMLKDNNYTNINDFYNNEIGDSYIAKLQYNISQLKTINLTNNDYVYNLSVLSPKFLKMLQNIYESPGLIFGYSQFKESEGIGIFSNILDQNGYSEFQFNNDKNEFMPNKLVRYEDKDTPNKWITGKILSVQDSSVTLYNDSILDKKKVYLCKYLKWVGATKEENRKRILDVFNSDSNKYGQQCLILLATSAGAEGISLKYVRQVHIFEPYWNQIRIKQVIGRARRYLSHVDLPKDQRNVSVFNYYTKFSESQKQNTIYDNLEKSLVDNPSYFIDEKFKTLFDENKSSFTKIMDEDRLLTSDEILINISGKKTKLIQNFLDITKQTSIDCIYNKIDNVRSDGGYIDINCVQLMTTNNDEPPLGTKHTYQFSPTTGDIIQEKITELRNIMFTVNPGIKILCMVPNEYRTLKEYLDSASVVVYGYNFYKYYNLERNDNKLYSEEIVGEINISKGNLIFYFYNSTEIKKSINGVIINKLFKQSLDYYKKIQNIIEKFFPEFLNQSNKEAIPQTIKDIKSKYKEIYPDVISPPLVKPTVSKWKCLACGKKNSITREICKCKQGTYTQYQTYKMKQKTIKKPQHKPDPLHKSDSDTIITTEPQQITDVVSTSSIPDTIDIQTQSDDVTSKLSGTEYIDNVVKDIRQKLNKTEISTDVQHIVSNKMKDISFPGLSNFNIYRNNGGGNNDCIIHSFLQLTSETFRNSLPIEQNEIASYFRRSFLYDWFKRPAIRKHLIQKDKFWSERGARLNKTFIQSVGELHSNRSELDETLLAEFAILNNINLIFIQPRPLSIRIIDKSLDSYINEIKKDLKIDSDNTTDIVDKSFIRLRLQGKIVDKSQYLRTNIENIMDALGKSINKNVEYFIIKNTPGHFEAVAPNDKYSVTHNSTDYNYLLKLARGPDAITQCKYNDGDTIKYKGENYTVIERKFQVENDKDLSGKFLPLKCINLMVQINSDAEAVPINISVDDITV